MNLPIDYNKVDEFVNEHKFFEQAREKLVDTLGRLYKEDALSFKADFYSELDDVLQNYKFDNYTISFSTSYSCKPKLNYISVYIDIYDKENSYVAYYQLIMNEDLETIDEKLGRYK